ncbi:hypothetical protein A8V01_05695 [Novosphingobium guangzhouense]|uniref:Holin-like toxin n=1 Tax=Novosphingobium guangzhouense TaxID=1850347 RepID=A0A2K2FZ81_9SPHN|nr:hypothetical protein A8V01_05695 [Novosphingobium guangzhouense]
MLILRAPHFQLSRWRSAGKPEFPLQREVIQIDIEIAILIIMACLAFTTLVLKVVEMSRNK